MSARDGEEMKDMNPQGTQSNSAPAEGGRVYSSPSSCEMEPSSEGCLSWISKRLEILHPHPDPATDPQEWVDGGVILGVWHVIMCTHLVYTACFLPIRICFNIVSILPWVPVDIVLDLLHFIDLWVKMRTASSQQGFFITNRAEIRRLYFRAVSGGFAFDLLAVIPIDYLMWPIVGYAPWYRVCEVFF